MDCPKCQRPMRTKDVHNIQIDECPQCRGTWFDQGELRRLKDHADDDISWMDFELWKHPERFKAAKQRMVCPRCGVALVSTAYDRTGVTVEICLQCRGIWLDAGEFEKIIQALQHELETKEASDYVKASLQEAYEIVTGREGFLSEWHDFTKVLRLLEYRILASHPRLHGFLTSLQASSPAGQS
jgi:Zn-finger nucleic acid-binding protein